MPVHWSCMSCINCRHSQLLSIFWKSFTIVSMFCVFHISELWWACSKFPCARRIFFTLYLGLILLPSFLVAWRIFLSTHLRIFDFRIRTALLPALWCLATSFSFTGSFTVVPREPDKLFYLAFHVQDLVSVDDWAQSAYFSVKKPTNGWCVWGWLFQRCHWSRWSNFTCSPKFHPFVCVFNFRFVRRLQEKLRPMWRFCLARIRLNPLSGKILHESVPVICLWIRIPHEGLCDRQLSSHQTFCPKWSFASASSARSNFGLSGSEYKCYASSIVTTFVGCSESESWEMCAGASTSVSSRLSVKLLTKIGRYANGSFTSFLTLLRDSCPSALVACSSLRSNTEPGDELDAPLLPDAWSACCLNDSCGSDVEDDLLPELTDNPGKTRGTKLSVLQMMFFPFLLKRGSWPLTHSYEHPWSSQSAAFAKRGLRQACLAMGLQACYRVLARLRTDWGHERTLVPPRGCALLHQQPTLLQGFWTSLLCPSLLSLILFCSYCALMLLD